MKHWIVDHTGSPLFSICALQVWNREDAAETEADVTCPRCKEMLNAEEGTDEN